MRKSIDSFLKAQFDKKTSPQQKKLTKVEEGEDFETAEELKEVLAEIKKKYELDNWMDYAANRMASGLKFGTHIAKGVHPDSKGDNITFQPTQGLGEGLVASQNIENQAIDANGNAASLPLAAFFEWAVDEEREIKIRHLIVENHPNIEGVFSTNPELSSQYQRRFSATLSNAIDIPISDERNKQLLWPKNDRADDNQYICIVPLYPSTLTHDMFNRINQARYSDENKIARDNRYKKIAEQKPYISIPDLARIKLGGTKPQNISQLVSKRGGRSYLLPSLPPKFIQTHLFRITQAQKTIFNKRLNYHFKDRIEALFNIVRINYNNVDIRDGRKAILDGILEQILTVATTIQTHNSPGWTKILKGLHLNEKLWLDPHRGELEGEKEFANDRETKPWRRDIEVRFGRWLNALLKSEFQRIKYDFGDDEQKEWEREMNDMIKRSQRMGLGVFL